VRCIVVMNVCDASLVSNDSASVEICIQGGKYEAGCLLGCCAMCSLVGVYWHFRSACYL
jgi:hypothetical protein